MICKITYICSIPFRLNSTKYILSQRELKKIEIFHTSNEILKIHKYCSLPKSPLAFYSAHTHQDWPFAWTVLNRHAAFTVKLMCAHEVSFQGETKKNASLEEQVGWLRLRYKGAISQAQCTNKCLCTYICVSDTEAVGVRARFISKYESRQHICVILCAKWPSSSLAGSGANSNLLVLMSNTSFKDKITEVLKSKWTIYFLNAYFWSCLSSELLFKM